MGLPALDQGPGVVFLVPDLEAVVGAGRDHARAKVVEVDGQHQVLVAVREGLKVAVRSHVRIGVTGGHKVRFEMVRDARVDARGVAVSRRVLDQRGDEVDLVNDIVRGHGEVEVRMAVM
jgi:hypothetical protein